MIVILMLLTGCEWLSSLFGSKDAVQYVVTAENGNEVTWIVTLELGFGLS